MDIQVKQFSDLSEQIIQEWRGLQQADRTLASPFYSPEFSQAVHWSGQTVSTALIFDAEHLVGVLPYHKKKLGIGVPVGGQISDYQGIIGPVKDNVSAKDLLKATRLKSYDFNHLPASQLSLSKGQFTQSVSPYLSLEQGFDAYLAERRSKKNKVLKNAIRNTRILERDIGPVRMVLNDKSDEAWETMVAWKNQSLAQMGVASIFDVDWANRTFETIRETDNPHFGGMVSSLYVDNKLAAVHFGMRSHDTLHWWFPTYNQGLSKYSPGIVLLLEVAKKLPELGITRLDLGRGSQPYKRAFASGETALCEGSIERLSSAAGSARVLRKMIEKLMVKRPGLSKPAQFQRRAFNRVLGAVYLPK